MSNVKRYVRIEGELPEWLIEAIEKNLAKLVGKMVAVRKGDGKGQYEWIPAGIYYSDEPFDDTKTLEDLVKSTSENKQMLNQLLSASQKASGISHIASVASIASAGVGIINLGVTTASLLILMHRIQNLESTILDAIDKSDMLRISSDFQTALRAANDAMKAKSDSFREGAVRSVLDFASQAQSEYLGRLNVDLDKLDDNIDPEHLAMLRGYLTNAIYCSNIRIQGYLAINEHELAIEEVQNFSSVLRSKTTQLIEAWMQHPAEFLLDENMSRTQISKYLSIQQWLKNIDDRGDLLFEMLMDVRADIRVELEILKREAESKNQTNAALNSSMLGAALLMATRLNPYTAIASSIISASGFLVSYWRNRSKDEVTFNDIKLNESEILLENYLRFEAYEMELRADRLSIENWQDLISDDFLAENPEFMIIDQEVWDSVFKNS